MFLKKGGGVFKLNPSKVYFFSSIQISYLSLIIFLSFLCKGDAAFIDIWCGISLDYVSGKGNGKAVESELGMFNGNLIG